MDDMPFVTGAIWHRRRGMTVQMRARERPGSGSGGGKSSNDSKMKAAVRKLTSQMKEDMKSAAELLDLLDKAVDGPIFDALHASAAYHSLATWKRKGGLTPSDKASPVLPKLAATVQDMCLKGQLEAREVSNVFWSLGQLSDGLVISKGLLMALVKSLGEKASGMDSQGLSNNLLACVQLKGVAPEVLTVLPKLAAQISIKAKDMGPQALSNSLWAAAQLKDVSPDLNEIVPAIVAQIQDKAKDMIPQHISNCLWAATRLKDSAPEVLEMVPALVEEIPRNQANFKLQEMCNCLEALVLLQDLVREVNDFLAAAPGGKNDVMGFTASRFSTLLPRLKGKDLRFAVPGVVWACARVNFYHEELLVSVAQRGKSGGTLQTVTDWGLCALQWAYDVLDPDGRFATFKNALESERLYRGLSDSDVSESALGIFEWNRAKGRETSR